MFSQVGVKIATLQAENDVSNVELARRMGIKAPNVVKMKKVKKLRYNTVHKLAKAFKVPVTEFLCF